VGSAPEGPRGSYSKKTLLNNVLDNVALPVLWLTNTPAENLNLSNCRRFDYSIEFVDFSKKQRLQIWKNSVEQHHLEDLFDETVLEQLAARFDVNAGVIANALKNIANIKPERDEVQKITSKILRQYCDLTRVRVSEKDKLAPSKNYTLDGLNIKTGNLPLERIIAAVKKFQDTIKENGGEHAPDRPRMNILLSGAPGSGKTEFVKYLGKILDTPVTIKMGSALLNKYVGESEKAIARAFTQAETEKAILFMDEIDGIFQTREKAFHSWEVTQVNELLHQMENFNGIFIAATNFTDNIDSASLRRFTYKIEFDYLDERGKRIFFERFFENSLNEIETLQLAEIENLTPGDFRTVRQMLYYLGGEVSNKDRLEALAKESESKSKTSFVRNGKRVGFMPE
jgi:SpoVK/Ycf46/Vps4 family AAA+-type ATPase